MAAPKPWETSSSMSSRPMPTTFNINSNGMVPTIENERPQTVATTVAPPPIPPPRTVQQPQPYGPYPPTNYLNPYSLNPYQAAGFYNNYRFTPYGPQSSMPTSNFAQLAIDESRSAFSSIESIINTFRSISYMLESTFTSVYSSFRAVTDLLDHFTRLRSELSAIYPLVLLWKFLKYLYHRLLRLLHLRQATSNSSEETWTAIYNNLQQARANVNAQANGASSSSSLLVALYFLVSFGTPILMLKFLNSMIQRRQKANNAWLEQEARQAQVVALYDYVARNPDELSFTKGSMIYLAPLTLQTPSSNWFLGSIDRIHTGLVPANYVQPVRQSSNSSITLQPQAPLNNTSMTSPLPPLPSSPYDNSQPAISAEEKPTLS